MRLTLAFLGPVLLFASCITAYNYPVDVLVPAEVSIAPGAKVVGVFSRNKLNISTQSYQGDTILQNRYNADTLIINASIQGLEDALIESPRFEVVKTSFLNLDLYSPANLQDPVSWTILERISPDKTEVLIEYLTSSMLDTVLRLPIEKNSIIDADYYAIIGQVYWRLYDLRKQETKVFGLLDTLRIDIREPGQTFLWANKNEMIQDFSHAGYQFGFKTGTSFAPSWESHNRIIYRSSIPAFRKAELLVRNGQWPDAAEYWRSFAYHENDYFASRACFNLALSAEMTGNFDRAIDWLILARERGLVKESNNYQQIIEERVQMMEVLDFQMEVRQKHE